MFSDIFNFNRQRTALQALGWYIVFMILGLVLGGILGGLAGMGATSTAEGLKSGAVLGARASVLYVAGIAVAVIWRRQKNFLNVSVAFLGAVIALFVGAIGGLIPVAILTTRTSSAAGQPNSN